MNRPFAALAGTPLALALVLASTSGAWAIPFVRADTNRDGLVTFEELHFVMPKLKEVSFNRFDSDKDGFIDQGEWSGLDAFYRFTYRSGGS